MEPQNISTPLDLLLDISKLNNGKAKTSHVQDFLDSGENVFIFPETDARLVTNFYQNANNEKDRMAKSGKLVNVSIHRRGGRGILINWDLVDEETAVTLKMNNYRLTRVGASHKTSVTKEIIETKEY